MIPVVAAKASFQSESRKEAQNAQDKFICAFLWLSLFFGANA